MAAGFCDDGWSRDLYEVGFSHFRLTRRAFPGGITGYCLWDFRGISFPRRGVIDMSIPRCSRSAACAFVLMSAVLWLACGLSGSTVLAADKAKAKAKPGGVPTRWNVKPDPPAAPLKWPDKL